MAEAKRDENRIPTLLAVSSVDGVTPVLLYADPITHRLFVDIPSGTGDVVGPATNTDGYIPLWDGADSKKLKNGLAVPAGGLAGITALNLKADASALANYELLANKSTNVVTDGSSDTKYPSVKAIKDYADGLVVGLLDYRGAYDASVNTFPTTGGSGTAGVVMKGDMWIISVAGTLGGTAVQIGDSLIANVDTPGQTASNWNVLNSNISYVPEDVANKKTTMTGNTASDTFYLTAKAIYDWAVGLFQTLANKVTSFQVTPDDAHYPSEKLVKDSLDAKAPTASPTFTGTVTLADNARIDLTLPTADTYVTGNTTDSFASGYSSAVGDLVFFGSGGKWLEVDADAVATCKGLIGIALEAKNDTEVIKVALPGSFVRLDSWNWTVGATLYAGETLGSMQETIPTGADAVIKVVGFAVSSDVIYFNPSPDQQTTVA